MSEGIAVPKTVPEAVPEKSDQQDDQGMDQIVVADDKTLVSKDLYMTMKSEGQDMSKFAYTQPKPEATIEDLEAKPDEENEEAPAPATDTSTPKKDEAEAGTGEPQEEWSEETIGSMNVRKNNKTGKTQIKCVIHGNEEWIDENQFHKNFQTNERNNKVSQELAQTKKELDAQAEFNKTLGMFAPATPEPKADEFGLDEFGDADFESPKPVQSAKPDEDNPLTAEVKALREQVELLKGSNEVSAQDQADLSAMNYAYDEAVQHAERKGIPFPPEEEGRVNPLLVSRIQAMAVNLGTTAREVSKVPSLMCKIVDSLSKPVVPAEAPKPDAEGLAVPPGAEAPRKETAKTTSTTKQLKKRMAENRKKAQQPGHDQDALDEEFYDLKRELDKVKTGG